MLVFVPYYIVKSSWVRQYEGFPTFNGHYVCIAKRLKRIWKEIQSNGFKICSCFEALQDTSYVISSNEYVQKQRTQYVPGQSYDLNLIKKNIQIHNQLIFISVKLLNKNNCSTYQQCVSITPYQLLYIQRVLRFSKLIFLSIFVQGLLFYRLTRLTVTTVNLTCDVYTFPLPMIFSNSV